MCKPIWTLKGLLQGGLALVMVPALIVFGIVAGTLLVLGLAVRVTYDMVVLNWALRKGRV